MQRLAELIAAVVHQKALQWDANLAIAECRRIAKQELGADPKEFDALVKECVKQSHA